MTLSAEQKQSYERDGYLVIDSGLSGAVLDGIVRDLEGQYDRKGTLAVPYKDESRIHDAWRVGANVLEAALCAAVHDTLRELYGRKPMPFQTLNFRVGSEQKPHSDTIHFNAKPSGFMCGVWLALEDIDGHNGPLVYYPGSQKLPEITFKDIGVRPCQSNYAKYEEFMENLVGNKTGKTPGEPELPPKLGLIRKGQALIWSANLIHGGAPQKDKTRTRHSLVTHFYFEGCSYFSPMHGNERFTFRKHPTWIALRREAAAGSWDALLSGRADLVIGAPAAGPPPAGATRQRRCT